MANASITLAKDPALSGRERRLWFVKFRTTAIVFFIMAAAYYALRMYQQVYARSAGLDSTTPEFDFYWMNLLKGELAVLVTGWVVLWSYLWMTRDRHLDQLKPEKELKRYFNFTLFILLYAFGFFALVPLFGENDAAWHQTVIRDTSFTASHIVLFYGTIPLYIMLGVGALLYATTRLPKFAARTSVPLVLAVAGPFMILPNLGYNEWGHAFWLMEEIFSHPLHWGFVVLGWSVLALGGLLVQVVLHITELIQKVRVAEAAA